MDDLKFYKELLKGTQERYNYHYLLYVYKREFDKNVDKEELKEMKKHLEHLEFKIDICKEYIEVLEGK